MVKHSKGIEQLKLISENFKKNKDIKELKEAIKTLPPEMIKLFYDMKKRMENEK